MESAKKENAPQILIVDDVEINLDLLEDIILNMGCIPKRADSVKKAAQLIDEELPQLILLDIFMPDIGGFEFCEKLKRNARTRDIPIVFITADTAKENKWKGFEVGGVDFIVKPFDMREVAMRLNTHLKMYQMRKELEDTNKYLHLVIESQMKRIEEEQRGTLYALAKLTEEDVEGHESHLDNVGRNSRILAQSLQLSPKFKEEISENFIEMIGIASMLHDIGKLRTPQGVMFNPLLEDIDEDELNYHAEQGAHILEQIYNLTYKNDFMAMAIDIARYHHTRYDGKGRPVGISGKDIPLAARIVCVTDVYAVLVTDYTNEITEDEAVELIVKRAGTYFDPDIVNIFQKIRKRLKKVER